MTENSLENLWKQFEELQSSLENFLYPETLKANILSLSKKSFDSLKETERKCSLYIENQSHNIPKQLHVTGFDDEQIWQQIQLQNGKVLNSTRKFLKHSREDNKLKNENDNPPQTDENENDLILEENDSENDEDIEEEEDENESDEDDEIPAEEDEYFHSEEKELKKYQRTVVDDRFFRLREMEEFLDEQDRKIEDGGEDDIDLFNEDLFENEEEDENDLMYNDFFDPPDQSEKPTKKRKKGNLEDADLDDCNDYETGRENKEDDSNENEENRGDVKSAFEQNQEKLKNKISRLEEANIASKPWQLMGESTGKNRPINSLLEEHVTFDHTSVGAPVITEQTTETLEDIIRTRIKDQAWDDVERKLKPRLEAHEYKRAPQLNMEKGKLSLAEVYEKEYLKQMEDDKEEKENPEHVVIRELTQKLFNKLDALSNFLYTPKPTKPEIQIISNTPSLHMEEVTPLIMTEVSQMAPEEIFDKKRVEIIGDGEKTKEQRVKERRAKKIKKKFAAKDKERKGKLQAKTDVRSMKKKAVDQLKKSVRNTIINQKDSVKSVKSSNIFFNRLQDEVTDNLSKQKKINQKISGGKKKTVQALKL